jgi:ABC-type transport system involved in multi-copper enzyme maturation permease subunit
MEWLRLVRAELRKLVTTRMPLAFVLVIVAISAATAIAVIYGTDMDGSKTFISTRQDQASLMAFAWNGMMGAGLFGAIAVAREYGHGTVVPTFLAQPRRSRAFLAQLAAVMLVAAMLSVFGAGLTVIAVALALPTTTFGFMATASDVGQILAASAFTGAMGGMLGAGIGGVVRNTGGAVTGVVLALFIAPPVAAQIASDAGSWVPAALSNVVAGVPGDVAVPAAILGLVAWAGVPAIASLITILRRDVV